MGINVLVVWPKHLDYPLWREFIHQNRFRFNQVIIIFTDMAQEKDYTRFVMESMKADNIIFDDVPRAESNEDWRSKAVNRGLVYSHAPWVWFTEQDFFPKDGFWEQVERMSNKADVVGYFQEGRLHPCCIFAKREVIDKTSRNFGVIQGKLDHFGIFQQEVKKMKDIIIGKMDNKVGYHMNGLSQNMFMLQNGEKPNYKQDEFKDYIKNCLLLNNLHPDFENLFERYLKDYEPGSLS